MTVHSLLDRRNGLFGEIVVYDFAGRRWLKNNGVLQGLVFLEPGTGVVDPTLPQGPGPIQGCTYSLAWLIAGSQCPAGHGVMLGLGAGEGVVGLLYNFPRLTLDVVEPDPVIFDMACAHFPLFQHYLDSGRLRVHSAWAEDFVRQPGRRFDFAIADIDGGTVGVDALFSDARFLDALAGLAPSCWTNLMTRIERPETTALFQRFGDCGLNLKAVFSCQPRTMNLIVTTCDVDLPAALAFTPYAHLDTAGAVEMRQRYAVLCRSAQDAAAPFQPLAARERTG